jgi:hypothetical protein
LINIGVKQYKITSDNILQNSADDCYLSPNDLVHELKIAHNMGGLSSAEKLANYNAMKAYNKYTVYPEDNGYDTPKNPYSPV